MTVKGLYDRGQAPQTRTIVSDAQLSVRNKTAGLGAKFFRRRFAIDDVERPTIHVPPGHGYVKFKKFIKHLKKFLVGSVSLC